MTGRRWLPPILWAALVLAVSSIPASGLPSVGTGDKLPHLGLYAVLGWLTARALDRPVPRWPALALAALAIALFGAIDEWHQRFIPGRHPEGADWIADLIGASLGLLGFRVAAARRELAR